MVRMLISLIVASFCLYYGILYENTIMITLAFALLLLLGFSVLEVFYRKFITKCHLEIPVSMVDTNNIVVKLLKTAPGKPVTCFWHSAQEKNTPVLLPHLTA